jgi:hypothetical protein
VFQAMLTLLLACCLRTIRECLLLLSKLMEGWLRLLQEQCDAMCEAMLTLLLTCCLQTIRECLLLLSKLMEGWMRLLQEQRLASSSLNTAADQRSSNTSIIRSSGRADQQQQPHSSSASRPEPGQPGSFRSSKEAAAAAAGLGAGAGSTAAASSSSSSRLGLDVHRLEGVLFMLLCSYDEAIRGDALALLDLTRLLHQELQALAQQMEVKLGSNMGQQPQQQQQQQQQQGLAAGGAAAGASSSSNALAGVSSSFTSVASSMTAAGVQDSVASLSAVAAGSVAAVAASGGSGSGGGFFFRHKPTMSRDSFEFMQTLGECK